MANFSGGLFCIKETLCGSSRGAHRREFNNAWKIGFLNKAVLAPPSYVFLSPKILGFGKIFQSYMDGAELGEY